MDGTARKNIKVGATVMVVQKQDQRAGNLTKGVVQRILTNSQNHPIVRNGKSVTLGYQPEVWKTWQ